MPHGETVIVRRAAATDHAAARRLLPEVFGAGGSPETLLLAVAGGEAIGAVAVAWRPTRGGGFPVRLAGTPTVARTLIEAAIDECRDDVARFESWGLIDEHGTQDVLLRALGFAAVRRVLYFEADGKRFHSMIDTIRNRMERAGRALAEARLIPLAEAPQAEVARMLSEELGADQGIAASIARSDVAVDRQKSVVLMVGDAVGGALLYRWADGLPEIDSNIVRPAWRGGWANVALLEKATRNGLEGGATAFRFSCDEDVRDTINLARRSGSASRGVKVLLDASLDDLA